MKQKLRRSRRSVFGKRRTHPALKALLWIVVCVAVVSAGFFGAKWMTEGPSVQDTSVGDSATPDTPSKGDTNDDQQVKPEDAKPSVDTPAITESIRAFYLPVSELSVDTLSETSTLQNAAKAGFNAVIFDLKDAEGNLLDMETESLYRYELGPHSSLTLVSAVDSKVRDYLVENGIEPAAVEAFAWVENE